MACVILPYNTEPDEGRSGSSDEVVEEAIHD